MKVSWDDYSQYMEKSKPCSKPPTSVYIYIYYRAMIEKEDVGR